MGAPAGNQFWKLRSKHGRDKLFKTPALLWDAAVEYFQWCEDNPYHKAEAKTVNIGNFESKIEIAKLPVLRPFTLQGLCLYWDCHTTYFHEFEANLKGKNDELSKDFTQICIRVREIIYNQKFSGAAAGFFNANIIARDLGLRDTKDVQVSVPEEQVFKIAGQTIKF